MLYVMLVYENTIYIVANYLCSSMCVLNIVNILLHSSVI